MIVLHQFQPAFGLPNASPFCMKVEVFLRLAGLAYRVDNTGNPLRAPKGKLPVIDDEGTVVADSSAILAHLVARHGVRLDEGWAPHEQAQAHALQRLFEEHLYWCVLHERWFSPEAWPTTRQAFFGALPAPARALVAALARRGMARELRGHGLGRHGREEIVARGRSDIDAVVRLLGQRPYFGGEAPRSIDAVAHAFIANLVWAPYELPLHRHARAQPMLRAYVERMHRHAFAELPVPRGANAAH